MCKIIVGTSFPLKALGCINPEMIQPILAPPKVRKKNLCQGFAVDQNFKMLTGVLTASSEEQSRLISQVGGFAWQCAVNNI